MSVSRSLHPFNGSEHGFVDSDFAQVFFYFCAPCAEVVAENQTD